MRHGACAKDTHIVDRSQRVFELGESLTKREMAKRTTKTNFSLEEVVEQCTRRDSDESEDDISDEERTSHLLTP